MGNIVKVMNNQPKVHTIGYAYHGVAGGAGTHTKSFRLLPGLNEVNADAWAAAKKLPVVAHLVKTRAFVEVQLKADAGIAKLSASDAIGIVKATLDREKLQEWLRAESRDPVKNALEDQIDKVSFDPEKDVVKPDEGIDLEPTNAALGLDGAEIASQVQAGVPQLDREDLEPVTSDAGLDNGSKAPVEPPAALTQQLSEVEAPKTAKPTAPARPATKPGRGR